jgi:endonuclease YncB( thermonuclease family)
MKKIPRLPMPRARGPAALLALLCGFGGFGVWLESSGWLYVWFPSLLPPPITSAGTGRLIRVSDGDTVVVRYGDLRLAVRLRGVDTAESVHPDATKNTAAGTAAATFAKSYLADKTVRIEFEQRKGLIEEDRHGRALGWLWIEAGAPGPEGDELFNATLVRQGYSAYETKFGISPRHHEAMLAAEREARRQR